ncbi:MAG: SDR family oxidoreductase [Oscillospiraceae bacterium]
MTQKTVFITGASRGIGFSTAKLLAENGYNVAVGFYKNEALAKKLCNDICANGMNAVPFLIDVSDENSVCNAVANVTKTFGNIDALVNNAGIAEVKMFADITEDLWAKMLDTNLSGAYRVCRAVLPQMVHKKCGAVVNISSMWGQTGASCEVHYSAAKGGVIALSKALAKEYAPCNIRVNCVCPGAVDTDMLSSFSAEDKKALCEEIPLGRLGTGNDIAKAVKFLLSEDAEYITGQVLGVNGGMVI